MQADPIYRCWEAVCAERESKPHCIYLSPKGSVFTQQKAVALSQLPHLFLLCGHYEGIDQRILDTIIDEEISDEESHYYGLLEKPQYTRPEVWHEQAVPPVLLSGHHKNIETWRFAASLQETREKRPDLYAKYVDKK